jgi:lysine-specific demethylase 3
MQVVCNANNLASLVKKNEGMQNWLDYYRFKYSRNRSQRPQTKVLLKMQSDIPLHV